MNPSCSRASPVAVVTAQRGTAHPRLDVGHVSGYLQEVPTPRRTTKERRAELADAALAIVETRGIVALTTKNLADAVGLTTGAIFRHFESLDALFVAVADHVGNLLDATYPSEQLPPVERLARFIEVRSTVVGDRVGVLRLMLSEQFALALPEAAARRLRAAIDTTRTFLVETITEAQAAKQVRADLGAQALAVIVMGAMQMIGLTRPKARHPQQANVVRATLMQLLATPIEPGGRRRP